MRGVQILKLPRTEAPGPIQAVFQGQTPVASRREELGIAPRAEPGLGLSHELARSLAPEQSPALERTQSLGPSLGL